MVEMGEGEYGESIRCIARGQRNGGWWVVLRFLEISQLVEEEAVKVDAFSST